MLALSCPYVGPILALCYPIMSTNLAEPCSNTFNMSFFPVRDPPWTRKPRKTHSFLIVPRSISGAPKATKHRKTRCFSTPRTKNTVIYRGSGGSEVTMRWPPPGSAAGAARHYNLRLPTEGLRQGHGPAALVAGARIKGYRPCRRPLFMSNAAANAFVRAPMRTSQSLLIIQRKLAKRCLRNPKKKKKIASSTTNLQAAGHTCPKTR